MNSVRTPPKIWNVHTGLHGNMLRNCSFHTWIAWINHPSSLYHKWKTFTINLHKCWNSHMPTMKNWCFQSVYSPYPSMCVQGQKH